MRNDFIKCVEGNLHVISDGEKGKAVLLLSGAGADNALLSWKHLIPALSPHCRVFALDWPKQGKSVPWNGLADHACLLRCVDAALDHFRLETASLVGLSQGGAVTLAYTLLHPGRVESFAALAPAGIIRFPAGFHQLLWLSAKLPRLTGAVSRLFFRNRRSAARALAAVFPVLPPDFDSIVDGVLEEVSRNGIGASDWQNNSIGFFRMRVNLADELGRITCPALFIQGGKDSAVKPEYTAAAAASIPGARLAVLENNGHWLNRQSPEKVNALILDFLNGTA